MLSALEALKLTVKSKIRLNVLDFVEQNIKSQALDGKRNALLSFSDKSTRDSIAPLLIELHYNIDLKDDYTIYVVW